MAMPQLHQSEKENFRALLEQANIGRVEERLNTIDTFLSIEDHVTVNELRDTLKERGFDYDLDFIEQCMENWVKFGFARKSKFEGQPERYEHMHLGAHHDHLVCVKCGGITEFRNDEIEKLQARTASEKGFHMLQHKMEVYGICCKCLSKRRSLMPLTMARRGERLVIREMRAGRSAHAKLTSLGFCPGDPIEIINNDNNGRLVLAHNNTRVAIGRGIADKIMVEFDK